MIRQDEDKQSLEELIHFGVLGMKWGKTRTKASGAEIIDARRRLEIKGQQAELVRSARRKTEKGSPARAKQDAKLNQMKASFLKNPDRVIAARLTRGEKAIVLMLGLTAVAAPVAVGAIGVSSAASRRIEFKQDKAKAAASKKTA
jgi:hypothetical protein